MDAACIAWETALPFPSRPFVSLLLPPLPTHPTPLSPPAHSSGVCLFLPVAVLLQLSPLLWFCFVAFVLGGACSFACQGWVLVCFLPPPSPPSFLCSACLLCAPSACSLPLLCCPSFPRCLLWLAVLVPFPPFPSPRLCVCVNTGRLFHNRFILTIQTNGHPTRS